jgi:predicted HAD superfamily Cof-like phosphohydrolase
MNAEQKMVLDFHRAFGIEIRERPGLPGLLTSKLRIDLIKEETKEFEEALAIGDLVGAADAIADLLYVVYGAAVTCGMDMEPIMAEVHRSNMTKVGGHKREDGKWMKPATYEPPVLQPILDEMTLS